MSTMVPMYGFGGGSGGTGATLTVTAPAGCTVTVSKDGKSKTKVAGADGKAVFKGLETGEWTLSIAEVEQTYGKTIHITADYTENFQVFAYIHITYPAGSTCTATDGVTTLTAPNTSGTWDCVVPNAGTWTFKLKNGFYETVSVTESGQSLAIDKWYLYKNGDMKTNITGGWSASGYTSNYGAVISGENKENYYLLDSASDYRVMGTVRSVDFSGFGQLKISGSANSDHVSFRLGNTKALDSSASVTHFGTGNKTHSIDLSGLQSKYFFSALVNRGINCTFYVYAIWLEV